MGHLHYHDHYELYFLKEGQHGYLINNKFYHVSSGDVILTPPKALHKSHNVQYRKSACIYFTESFLKAHFSEKTLDELLTCFEKEVISLDKKGLFQALKLISELLKCRDNYDNSRTILYLGSLLMLLTEQKDNIKETHLPYAQKNIDSIMHYIEEHYKEIDRLDDIAAHFFVSTSYLCRIFKKHTGMTIVNYINHLKIKSACELLSNTNQTIIDIAQNCGFNTSIYFCKIFKKIVGCTPSEYRNFTC